MRVSTLTKWQNITRAKLCTTAKVGATSITIRVWELMVFPLDDIHIATLTVAQTLSFALSLKTPGPKNRLPGVSRKEFQQEVLQMLLKMLNIQHTTNTLVGDEFVRGVSGGERKRVSIAEVSTLRLLYNFGGESRGLSCPR